MLALVLRGRVVKRCGGRGGCRGGRGAAGVRIKCRVRIRIKGCTVIPALEQKDPRSDRDPISRGVSPPPISHNGGIKGFLGVRRGFSHRLRGSGNGASPNCCWWGRGAHRAAGKGGPRRRRGGMGVLFHPSWGVLQLAAPQGPHSSHCSLSYPITTG